MGDGREGGGREREGEREREGQGTATLRAGCMVGMEGDSSPAGGTDGGGGRGQLPSGRGRREGWRGTVPL